MRKRRISAILAAVAVTSMMGITVLAGQDSCNLSGGGYTGQGTLRSTGVDSYQGQTSSNGCDNRVRVRAINHYGEFVTNTDSGIVGKTAVANTSYAWDGTIGASSWHYLYLHGDLLCDPEYCNV